MSHEDLTGYTARLAEMRDEATDPRDVLAYTRALDALRAWSGGEYGERTRKVRLWAVVWRSLADRAQIVRNTVQPCRD